MPLSLLTMMVRLPRFFSPRISTDPIDFGDHGRVLRLAGLEDLRHSRQTARDILRTAGFAWRLGDDGAGRNRLSFLGIDVGSFRQVIDVERLAVFIFDHDLRVQFTFVIDDQPTDVATLVLFQPHRFAFDDIFVANPAGDIRREWGYCADPIGRGSLPALTS